MLNALMSKAKDTMSNVSSEAVESTVIETVKDVKKDTNTIIDKYWPIMEEVLLKQLLSTAESGLNNDEALEKIFSTTYDLMPLPVRLVLSERTFIQFCMDRKKPILDKLATYKSPKNKSVDVVESVIPEVAPQNLYSELLPELLALCIVADGLVERGEIQLATDIIVNDLILEDKEKALSALSTHVGSLMMQKSNKQSVFKLKSMDIFSKISKITDQNEKARINIIVEGMIEVANKELLSETKEVTDGILKSIE